MSEENVLAGLGTSTDVKDEKDNLGGFQVLESNVYGFKIMNAFISFSKKKAMALNMHCKNADGVELTQQVYVTSGEEKGCKNYYIDKDGDKRYLPGFNVGNAVALLTVGKELSALDTTDGVAEIFGEKTKVKLLPQLIGKDIDLGIIKMVEDKRAFNDQSKKYEPTGETREVNDIDKVFRSRDGLTTVEIRAKIEAPEFKEKWLAKWMGQTRDKSTGKGAGVNAGAPAAAAGAAAPTETIFS